MAVADNVQDVDESETYSIQKGQDVLSGVVKGVHAHLRAEFATGRSIVFRSSYGNYTHLDYP